VHPLDELRALRDKLRASLDPKSRDNQLAHLGNSDRRERQRLLSEIEATIGSFEKASDTAGKDNARGDQAEDG
jgi:hypothetical protein